MKKLVQINGIDVDALKALAEQIKKNPDLAKESGNKWSARVQWLGGTRNKVYSRTHAIESDEPEHLLGSDTAPGPTELLLGAMGTCLAVTYVANAAARGIKIDSFELGLEGDIDLPAFFGFKDANPGFSTIKVKAYVKSSAPKDELQKLLEHAVKHSPVTNTVSRSVKIVPEIAS